MYMYILDFESLGDADSDGDGIKDSADDDDDNDGLLDNGTFIRFTYYHILLLTKGFYRGFEL